MPESARYILRRETQANVLRKTQTSVQLTHPTETEPALTTSAEGLRFRLKLATTDEFLTHYGLSNVQPRSRHDHVRRAVARFPSSRLQDASPGDRGGRPGVPAATLHGCAGPARKPEPSSASGTSRPASPVHCVNFRRAGNDGAVRSCSSERLTSRCALQRGTLARQAPTCLRAERVTGGDRAYGAAHLRNSEVSGTALGDNHAWH